jgi:TolA-binding protein
MVDLPKDESQEHLGLLVVTELARESFEPLSETHSEQAFEATLGRALAVRGRERRRWQALYVAAAAVLLLVVGVATSRFLARPKPLAMSFDGAELRQDGFVRAAAEGQPSVRFSDGTRIGLGESASLRVRSIDARGARIAVEGQIRADVVHAPLAGWVFEAGPFVIDVKGTTFALAWSRAEGRLDLRLERGLLAIHTPFTSEPIALSGGQRLVATAGDKRFLISALTAPEASGAAADGADGVAAPVGAPAIPATPVASSSGVAAPQGSTAARSAWAERFAAGDFRAIVAEAESRGLDAALAQRGLEELGLLADAARYTGKTGLARRALLSERQRFAKSGRAIDAAFMLGRLEEPGDAEEAARWYDRYLADAPRGSYAAEALGRKMMLVERLRGAAAARSLAEEYAKKYPQGPHARSAQLILSPGKAGP